MQRRCHDGGNSNGVAQHWNWAQSLAAAQSSWVMGAVSAPRRVVLIGESPNAEKLSVRLPSKATVGPRSLQRSKGSVAHETNSGVRWSDGVVRPPFVCGTLPRIPGMATQPPTRLNKSDAGVST